MRQDRARDWLSQAEDDLRWGEHSLGAKYFAQTCFVSQQVAEKALKALALFRGAQEVRSHSVTAIAKSLSINSEVEEAGKRLDQYYISARYPDAFPEGTPSGFFTEHQAIEALGLARLIVTKVQSEINGE